MTISIRALCASCALAAMTTEARADSFDFEPVGSMDLPFDHGTVSLALRGTSPSTFGQDSYHDGSVALRGALPIYSRRGFFVLAQLRVETERVTADMFANAEAIEKGALGVTAQYISDRADLYALHVAAAIAASRDTVAHASVMPTVIGVATYRTSPEWTWIYGGGFGYALGRSWLLPLAGVMWKIQSDWEVTTILPVLARVKHAFGSRVDADVTLAIDGDRFDFANDGAFSGAGAQLQLRLAQLRMGLGVVYRWGGHWSWRAEVGAIAPRALAIGDGDTTVMSAASPGAGYLSTKLSYAFDAF